MARRPSLAPADSAGEPILLDDSDPEALLDMTEIDISEPMEAVMIDGAMAEEMGDGGVSFDFDPQPMSMMDPMLQFDANLAAFMSESDRDGVAQRISEAVDQDKESRQEWEGALADGIKLLGLNVEKRTVPFDGACGVFDPVMSEAVMRFQAEASGEMLPAKGPVKAEIFGIETAEARDRAMRKQEWMNYYLTQGAPEYYADFDQMLMWLPLVGSTFKKVYQDPTQGRPVAPFILPQDFVVPYTATDLATTPRATQFVPTTFAQLHRLQIAGAYLDVELATPDGMAVSTEDSPIKQQADASMGLTPSAPLNSMPEDATYQIAETHCDLDLNGFEHVDDSGALTGLPLPYRVTYDAESKKCLAIYRNWKEGDPRYNRVQWFVHYKFIPGFGFYGLGYAHLLGGTAKTGTTLRRQMIDAETLAMFPGGLRVKGMKLKENNIGIGPTEFREIDTGGLPIQQAIMAMPYKGANEVSMMLLKENNDGARSIAGTSEIAVGDGRQDAPVGTTVALMEAATKPQTAILKRAYRAQGSELKMMADLFGQYLPEDKPYPFVVRGEKMQIIRADFAQNAEIVPVANPVITSSTQRMVRAEALVRSAGQAPQIHDMRAAYALMYREMNVSDEEIRQILPVPDEAKPLDPLSENMNALMQKPLRAALYQDHVAHIAAHASLAQAPSMEAHIDEDMAMKMRVQVEQLLGIQLPPPGAQLPPEIENQIAVLVAKAMEMIKQQEQGGEPSQGQLMLEQLKIEAQKVAQKAQEAAQKAQTEKYKADLKYGEKIADIQGRENVARINAAADMADNETPAPPYARRLLRQ